MYHGQNMAHCFNCETLKGILMTSQSIKRLLNVGKALYCGDYFFHYLFVPAPKVTHIFSFLETTDFVRSFCTKINCRQYNLKVDSRQ